MITIFHPSDFSPASESGFAHALKIALVTKAHLQIMHVAEQDADVHWIDFPGVRATLSRWGILSEGSRKEDVAKIGLYAEKVLARSRDPVDSILHHLEDHPVDLIVLATHQRDGLARWFHRAVAEPIARRSGATTLFLPQSGKGFISSASGNVTLTRVVLPIDRVPNPQPAVQKAVALATALECREVSFTLVHIGEKSDVPPIRTPLRDGWSWRTMVRNGEVVTEIEQAEAECSADLMVLATQGHSSFLDVLRGSTTERVLRRAKCPVLAVPVNS